MQFLLLLQVCLLGLGLSVASPGRRFLIGLPPHNGPTGNVSHQVTITASGVRTSVTVKVLESSFVQRIYLSAHQSKRIHLPLSVGMTSDRSSSLLSVKSIWPVTVITSLCTRAGCDHSLLHDVYSWGTQYYPITPNFPNQTSVSQMVITSSDQATSVDIFLSGEVLYEGNMYQRGSVLKLYIGVLQSVYLQSNSSLSGSELNSQEAVGVVKPTFPQLPDNAEALYTDKDVGYYLSTLDRHLYSALCEKTATSLQISIQGFNISIVKEDKNHVRVNGQMRNLPLTVGNGSLNFYQSGSSVVLDTAFDLALRYDWKQHLQVEVGPELYGALCAASSMCEILTDYANICQRISARVRNWRTIAKCPMVCPLNSHYEICGSACPATCGNPEAHSSYYYPKENFWMGKHCQERCVCQSSSKRVVCSPSQCQDGEVCKVVNGVMGCHAEGPGLCIAKVDPHYTTFDGRNFDVYGNCTYLLTSLCPTWGDMEAFSVEIQNQIKDATNIVSFRHLKMVVAGYSIEMSNDPSNGVEVNGLLLRLPSVLSRGKVKLYMTGQTKFIETDFGVVVMYSSDILTIQMPRKFSGNLCGLCGNFNSNPEDDVMPDDDSDISQAVRHWKTSSDHECVDVPMKTSGCNSQEMAVYEGKGFCARLLDKEGVFKSCHKMVDPEGFHNNCVQDFCSSNQTSLCQILSSYVAVCQEMGAKVNEWRTSTFCGLSCPPNSEYSLCASQISDCVENRSPLAGKCKEGCFCKPGYFHSGGKCVPDPECGCIHNDIYYEIHENFYPDDHCQLHCVCVGHKRVCEDEESDLTVIIQQEQLHLRVHGVNVSLEMAQLGKVKIDGVLRSLPLLLDHMAILHSGLLSRIVVDTGVVVTYGASDLIHILIPASSKQMCGLCGKVSAVVTNDKRLPNYSFASDVSIFASSWSLSPPGTNCSKECDLCLECNSTMAAEYASANFCGMLLAPAGSFSECHSAVDPEPFFQNCVNDLCLSNGKEEFVCSSLRHYALACQEAGAETKPWRGAKCSLLCPENSHIIYVPVHALSPVSGNGCVKADKCGCFHLGHYYEIGEISWGEGCSEQCNCSAAADMCCEPASCPKGESCTLLNTWGCAKKDNNTNICEDGETCVSEPLQTQCWVLGGAHFYTFDGKVFEFLGNCTYTLVHVLNYTSENTTFWVGVEKDRTPNEASSLKAIHVKVAEDNVTIYRGEKGHAWMNGEKKLLPVTLQFGHVKIYRSGMFVVVDTSLGIQVKYDCSHVATILLSNTMEVYGMCGNNNGIEEDDLRTPQGEPVDATTFGWSWRVPDQEAQCTADCGNACPRCSAEQLLEKNVATRWISMHEYIWSPQNPFYQCREVVNYTKISAAVSMFDLCSSNDTRKTICPVLEAYVAACQNAGIKIGEWRNVTFCPISCPRNSHYTSCGSSCPATCEDPFRSRPCTLACVETCQCDPGFVLVADSCVPLSQCGCTHNGSHYRSNQTFWADEGCTELCVCDPNTHQTQCHLDSCGPNEYCSLQYGVRGCVPHALQTCMYSAHHIITFDQHNYDLHGSCQLLGMCAEKQGLSAIQIHAQTDGHLESALHLLVNVSGVLVELNSNNTKSIEVDGVKRNMPYRFSSTALAFSLGLHTYIYTEMGFELSLSIEGIVSISLSSKYANVTCGLCGNFNSDPADDLAVNGTQEPLIPEHFGKAWRSGQTPWCVEGCLGGSCPKCSSELLVRFSDPESCGKILEVNGPFRQCHGKVDPSSYYKRCVSDLCLHGGLQPALCHSLAEYAAVCLSHNATVSAWRSPGFCYPPCPTRTSYNISSASVHLCLGWQNKTVEMPLNMAENCLCEAGLTCLDKLDVEPIWIAAMGNYSEGRQLYLQVNKMQLRTSAAFPGKVEVNGVYENLPFSQSNITVHQRNGGITIKTPQSVELTSDLQNYILVKMPDIYYQTTCGLCGKYNDDPSDDLQLPNGTVTSDPHILGLSWKLFNADLPCSEECESSSDLNCGFIPNPRGPFSCHRLVCPQKYYSLCVAEGRRRALCDVLQDNATCNEAGGRVELWLNTTSCAYQCPQFSHYSNCTNICSSQCPEISLAVLCPRDCEEGCQCDTGHLYDGRACVPAEQCGCLQDGSRFKASESKLLQNCTVKCTCGPLVCEQYACPALHSCQVSDGIEGCHKNEQNPDSCEGKCDATEKCYLSNGVPVCESRQGLCWAWGGRHYQTFDGLIYDFEGTCTYLLAASKGAACGLTPFSVSKKDCSGIILHAYGFIIKLGSQKGSIHVNGQVTYIPVNILGGKIQLSHWEGKALLTTDFGLHLIFDGNSTVLVKLEPHYKGEVYGLCGNFNGQPQDEYPDSVTNKKSVDFAQAYQLFDGDQKCCNGCKQKVNHEKLLADSVFDDVWGPCEVLTDQTGPFAHCHSRVSPDSFYKSCVVDHVQNGRSEVSLEQAIYSYSLVCEATRKYYNDGVIVDVHCPPNTHYKTCGSACPPSCEFNATFYNKACFQGCFYDCGQICICGPATGEMHCRPAQCPRGMLVVRKDEPGKVMVDGQYKALPYSHLTGHVYAYRTPSSIIIHTDVGLQLIVYNTGMLRVNLPSSYGSSVSGLCGNANTDSHDDLMMPNEELAQNRLEFAHSWISPGSDACKSNCSSRLKHCPAEAQKLFEGSDFCGVLLNELGPFADCALVLSPKLYFHNCVTDSCSFDGHYSALCKSIASYADACQVAQLPVRQWRSDTFCGMSCPKNSHYELCGPRCPVVCLGLSSPANCSVGCEEGCQCDPGFVLSDGQCVPVSDCGCVHEGQYRPTGHFISEKSCQKCDCQRGVVTCSPMESCSVKDGLALTYGVCQVFAGFGYITFDGVILPHHGACTYVVSALSSKALHDYSLLLSFKDNKGIFTISKVVFDLPSLELSIDPESLWKIKVNREERRVPFDIGELKAYQDGNRLIIITPSGVGIDLSSTQYLRLTVPQVNDATASGLCGNFNGDKYDDLELRNGSLSESFAELLHSWAAPGQLCTDTCGRECHECRLSPHDTMVCDVLFINTTEFHSAGTLMWSANGIAVGTWRVNTPCALQCPDRSSSKECVDSSSNSCPAVLQPGSSATGCSEGCECDNGNVFDGEECVPYSQCGCVHHGVYIKMDEQVYNEDCTQRCWCHPLGGVICEEAGCSLGQQCALRNSFWGCHDRPEGCELRGSLQVSTLGGQQLSLDPLSSYSLMSLCDKASVHWFSLISYHGPCDGSSRLVTVFQILLHGTSFTIQEGTVKVNGRFMSLPHILPSGVSLSSGVNQDKSEANCVVSVETLMTCTHTLQSGHGFYLTFLA
ncbi:Alpha-tectorin, partial [Dissostichus eleginoides]